MKRYDKYKNSGVQWIGQVPEHWEVAPFKRAVTINNGRDYKDVQAEDGYPVIGSGGQFAYATDYLYDGEALLLGRKGTIDRPLYVNEKFWTVDTMFYALPLKGNFCKYLYYLSSTFPFDRYATSTALPSMTQTDLGGHLVALPPLSEQKAIAEWLDERTERIDRIIATREKQIELLEEMKSAVISRAVTKGLNPDAKMKDSGIEWIGEVPEHWEVNKVSRLFKEIGSGTTPVKDKGYYSEEIISEEGYFWLQTGDLNDGIISSTSKLITDEAIKNISALKLFKAGGIVIAMYGATIGKLGILTVDTYTNQACCVLNYPYEILIKFAFYLFWKAKEPLILESRGGGQPNISQDIIRQFLLPLPPLSEQQEIVSYLDRETKKIEKRIERCRKQIELLREYKSTLISDAVTGKIRVC